MIVAFFGLVNPHNKNFNLVKFLDISIIFCSSPFKGNAVQIAPTLTHKLTDVTGSGIDNPVQQSNTNLGNESIIKFVKGVFE